MKLTFHGAAKIVTGSCFLVESGGEKVLVDCGMFQGSKEITRLNYEPFRFDPSEISFMLLTHAHIDHSGLIPKLVKNGFRGKIFATAPTVDLTRIMLEDTAQINADDTLHENKRRELQGLEPRDPLYTLEDARESFKYLFPAKYDQEYRLTDKISTRFRDAGHILGSAILEITVIEKGKPVKIVFSGDLGQGNTPIVNDPAMIDSADYVLVESTYGMREHGDAGIREELLLNEVKDTFKRNGKLLIPSFAVERTQELLFYFHLLVKEGKLPSEMIFLDSPLAIKATDIFKKYGRYFSPTINKEFKSPFTFNNLKYVKTTEESKKLNDYNKPCIIIAGSGMCTSGRIRHHIRHNIWKPENTLLFVGYQAEGTMGRYILEGSKMITMMGMHIAVKARVAHIDSFSSHADCEKLISWMRNFKKKPRKVFVIHGEKEAAEEFKSRLTDLGFEAQVPDLDESVELS